MAHDHDTLPGTIPADLAAKITRRTAILSVGVALTLVGLKLWAWLASGSVAMLSSLADSGLDSAASLFTLAAVSYAAMPPDEDHRHGHGKAEGFAGVVQAMLVGVAATLVALEAIDHIRAPREVTQSGLAIGVMAVSIALTIALLWAQTRAIRQTGSVATEGDRAHYLSDLAANFAVIGGIVATGVFGLPWADPIIGLGVAAWLAWTALGVAQGGINQLLDRELPDGAREKIRRLALRDGHLLDVHALRTRASGPYVHIQFHADLPPGISLDEAHRRMVAAERSILTAFPAADILIHPDPRGRAEAHGGDVFGSPEPADAA
ncbi:MAG: cation diffusion facilitator family transporter [Pseudomonadota bacterium]